MNVPHYRGFIMQCLLVLSLLGLFAAAAFGQQNPPVLNNPQPQFVFTFHEEVMVLHAVFQNTGTGAETIGESSYLNNNKTKVSLKPARALSNGLYHLVANVSDRVGNTVVVSRDFSIEVPEMDITLLRPRLGMANTSVFDITIKTSLTGRPESSQCKYYPASPSFPLTFDAYGLQSFSESNTANSEHTLRGFSGIIPDRPLTALAPFHVVCRDSIGREKTSRFNLYADTKKPELEAVMVDPVIISDRSEGGVFKTELKVTAKNQDAIICKYSIQSNDYEQMQQFDNYNREDFNAYRPNHTQTVDDFDPNMEIKDYTLHVACEDRAGHVSDIAVRQVKVDLSVGLQIEVLKPANYSAEQYVELRLRTNKAAHCLWGRENEEPSNPLSPTSNQPASKTHTAALGRYAEGSHQIKVFCTSGFLQPAEKVITFIIDTAPPSTPSITGPSITCRNDGLYFEPALRFSASDPSGIKQYLYSLRGPSGTLLDFTPSGDSLSSITQDSQGRALNITFGRYTISVKAVDNTGLEGQAGSHTAVYDPSHQQCREKIPPSITLLKETAVNGMQVSVQCQDDTACDNSTYYYNTAETRDACSPIKRLYPPFTETLYSTAYFCYNVSDVNGNSAAGGESIAVSLTPQDHCTDSQKNEDETDIDCGGTACQPCSNEKSCSVNTDCLSGFCDERDRACVTASCEDRIKNQDETDTDCGGNCQPCDIGQSCIFNADCASMFCQGSLCQEASCEDGVMNGDESDIDCGGSCSNACADGMRCNVHTDCSSGTCEFGFCGGALPQPAGGDTDGDGMPDQWEVQNNLNSNDPSDAALDNDDDGLTNLEEYQYGTDPNAEDTDGDGYSDKEEIDAGTDPNSVEEMPTSTFAGMFTNLLLWIGLLLLAYGLFYLSYNKYYKKPMEEQQRKRERQATPSFTPTTRPSTAAPVRRPLMDERQRRLAEMRERLQKEKEMKQRERERIFSAFGGREERPPTRTAEVFQKAKVPGVAPVVKAVQRTEKGVLEGLEELAKGEKKVAKKITGKAEDVFAELEAIAKKGKPAAKRKPTAGKKKAATKPKRAKKK